MFKRILLAVGIAFSVAACASGPETKPHNVSEDVISSYRIASVEVVTAPGIKIPAGAHQLQHLVKSTYMDEFRHALRGKRTAHLTVYISAIQMFTDDEKAAAIIANGILGGPFAAAAGASLAEKVGMDAVISLTDGKTNTTIATTKLRTLITPPKGSDPASIIAAQGARDARNWLMKTQ